VRAPTYDVVHDRAEAFAFAERHGLPVVLKAEESFAGLGVSVCQNEAALAAAIARMAASNPAALEQGMQLQTFVAGRTAMRAVVAWRGEVLAGLSAIKVETHPGSTGPSAVVQFIENGEMRSTAQAMIRALGYSGFASLDFILDAADQAHLIELNSRPTPICHLGDHLGLDLCLRLREAIEGKTSADGDPAGLPKKVALFPQEWIRNANSPHFADSFHDVPWDDPDMVEAFVILARAQMRGGQWHYQEARRERVRQLLDKLNVPSA
jgi:predicted ATP-grasp superfamily ATP-dependent carboligase